MHLSNTETWKINDYLMIEIPYEKLLNKILIVALLISDKYQKLFFNKKHTLLRHSYI